MYIEIESLPPPLLTPPTNCLPQENQLGLGKRDLRSAVLELHFLGYFCHQRWHCLPNDRDQGHEVWGHTVWSLKTEWKQPSFSLFSPKGSAMPRVGGKQVAVLSVLSAIRDRSSYLTFFPTHSPRSTPHLNCQLCGICKNLDLSKFQGFFFHFSDRADRPITDRLPMTKHLFISSSHVVDFE